jgi:hypothetical protein
MWEFIYFNSHSGGRWASGVGRYVLPDRGAYLADRAGEELAVLDGLWDWEFVLHQESFVDVCYLCKVLLIKQLNIKARMKSETNHF